MIVRIWVQPCDWLNDFEPITGNDAAWLQRLFQQHKKQWIDTVAVWASREVDAELRLVTGSSKTVLQIRPIEDLVQNFTLG